MEGYYREHPERLGDVRGEEARRVSLEGVKGAFAILDEYTIVKKEKL